MGFGNPAQRYRQRVDEAGGVLAQQAKQVGKAFGRSVLKPDAAAEVTQLLANEGVSVDPALDAVGEREFVQLYTQQREPERQPDQTLTPDRQTFDEALQAAENGTQTTVLVGAAATTAGFAVLGFAGYWVYGMTYLLLGALGLGVLWFRLPWFVRWFFPRFRFLRLSWWLGAGWILGLALLASLFIISPIAGGRQAQARERDAEREVRLARASLRDGDLRDVERHLDKARDRDDSVAGLSKTEDDLRDANERKADEDRNRRRYAGANEAMRNDEYATAITNMAALGDYQDAEEKTKKFRATASRATLATARRETDLNMALATARRADGYQSTPQTRGFIRRTERRIAGIRRARRIRQRQAAERRRVAAQQRREARRQEEAAEAERRRLAEQQEQRELEEELAPPSSDGGGGGGTGVPGCLGPESCPGKRDGDGDGCYCE